MATSMDIFKFVEVHEWDDFLKKIENRKIVIFGATEIAKELVKFLPYKIECYVDNDSKKWGKYINDIFIDTPEILLSATEQTVVLVTNNYFKEISNQINEYNNDKVDVIDYGKLLIKTKSAIKIEGYYKKYCKYIEEILSDAKQGTYSDFKNSKPIGVVVYSYLFTNVPWYFITLSLLLKYSGYNVMIIWDDLSIQSDMVLDWDGASDIQNEYVEKSIKLVNEKFCIPYIKISEISKIDLSKEDFNEVDRLSEINTLWKYRKSSMNDEITDYKSKYAKILEWNLKHIKKLFRTVEFDKIVMLTGIYDNMGLYSWVSDTVNIEASSIDISPNGGFVSTNFPCCHQMDIKKILDNNLLKTEFTNKVIKIGEETFKTKIDSNVQNFKEGLWQKKAYRRDSFVEKYDVIIPLNISWDAAALKKERLFDTVEQWVIETIEFVLNNTEGSVAVRQHPAESFVDSANHFFLKYNDIEVKYKSGEDLYNKLIKLYGNNSRFRYIKSEEDINTYELIEKSKVVLPHTSTVGLEAMLMGKNVLLASDAYYSNIGILDLIPSKEDYFSMIKHYIDNNVELNETTIRTVKLAYGLVKLNFFNPIFSISSVEWIDLCFFDLLNDKDTIKILKIIGEGIPLSVLNAME